MNTQTAGAAQEDEPPAVPARRDSLGKTVLEFWNHERIISRDVFIVSESSVTSHQSSQPAKANLSRQGSTVGSSSVQGQPNKAPLDDSEDTMKNLRKTFAGIFGEM